MKKTGGLSKLFEMQIVRAHIQQGMVQQAVQHGHNGRLGRSRHSRQDEVPPAKLELLGNLAQPRIFKQLRQQMLGEHASVENRGVAAALRGDEVAAPIARAPEGQVRI
jgi:hypothetical protein